MTALDKAFIKVYDRDRFSRAVGLRRSGESPQRYGVSIAPISQTLARMAGGSPAPLVSDLMAAIEPVKVSSSLTIYAEEQPDLYVEEAPTIDESPIKLKPAPEPIWEPTVNVVRNTVGVVYRVDVQTPIVDGPVFEDSSLEEPTVATLVETRAVAEPQAIVAAEAVTETVVAAEASVQFAAVVERPTTETLVAFHEPLAGSLYPEAAQATMAARAQLSENFRTLASRPLSTFVGTTDTTAAFRPLLEVDRFAWPEVCGLLLGHVAADFDAFAEMLATKTQEGQKVVAISGCHRGEGRTTILLCLAQRLASCGVKSVLFDADLARADLARRMGISAQVGWEDVVTGQASLADVLIASVDDQLSLVPRRRKSERPSREIGELQTAAMFATLRDAYDLVLIDCGPASGEQDRTDLAKLADATRMDGIYLVCDARGNDSATVGEAMRRAGLPLSGLIENFTAPTTAIV